MLCSALYYTIKRNTDDSDLGIKASDVSEYIKWDDSSQALEKPGEEESRRQPDHPKTFCNIQPFQGRPAVLALPSILVYQTPKKHRTRHLQKAQLATSDRV